MFATVIANATYLAEPTTNKSSGIAGYLPLLLLALFAVFMIRSSRRRAAAVRQQSADLQVGLEVVTRAGQIGRITDLSDTEVSLEIAPGVVCRYVRGAILQVFVPPSADVQDAAEQGRDDADPEHGG